MGSKGVKLATQLHLVPGLRMRRYTSTSPYTFTAYIGEYFYSTNHVRTIKLYDVTACGLVNIYRRFEQTCCLHKQGTLKTEAEATKRWHRSQYKAPRTSRQSSAQSVHRITALYNTAQRCLLPVVAPLCPGRSASSVKKTPILRCTFRSGHRHTSATCPAHLTLHDLKALRISN